MSEKEIEKLYKQINNLTTVEFSKLCLKIVKKIVSRKPTNEKIEKHIHKPDIDVLIKLMIENNIKIGEKE